MVPNLAIPNLWASCSPPKKGTTTSKDHLPYRRVLEPHSHDGQRNAQKENGRASNTQYDAAAISVDWLACTCLLERKGLFNILRLAVRVNKEKVRCLVKQTKIQKQKQVSNSFAENRQNTNHLQGFSFCSLCHTQALTIERSTQSPKLGKKKHPTKAFIAMPAEPHQLGQHP